MIRKSAKRFSEKIMRNQESRARCRFILISSRASNGQVRTCSNRPTNPASGMTMVRSLKRALFQLLYLRRHIGVTTDSVRGVAAL